MMNKTKRIPITTESERYYTLEELAAIKCISVTSLEYMLKHNPPGSVMLVQGPGPIRSYKLTDFNRWFYNYPRGGKMNKLIVMVIGLMLSFNVMALETKFYVKDPSEPIVVRIVDFFTNTELTRVDYGLQNPGELLFFVEDSYTKYLWSFYDNTIFLYVTDVRSPYIIEVSNLVSSVPEPSTWIMILFGLGWVFFNVKLRKVKV